MDTIIVTSINPFSRLDYQKECFYQWKKRGYKLKTFNDQRETELLLKTGFLEEDVDTIATEETAYKLFGKSIPRVLPVLRRAMSYRTKYIILVNSDIYPSHRKFISNYLATLADCIALTRNETFNIENNRFIDSSPYRGGMDIFFFTREKLRKILENFENGDLAERMTFGIPGWDYYLGHVVLYTHDGLMMDGEVFLHQSHKTTYNQITEFNSFAEEMLKSNFYESNSATELASEFSALIDYNCSKNKDNSNKIRFLYYEKPQLNIANYIPNQVKYIEEMFNRLLLNYGVEYQFDRKRIRGFISNQVENLNWSSAEAYRNTDLSTIPIVSGYLLILLAQLCIKKFVQRSLVSYDYPEGSLHGVALKQILTNTKGKERLSYVIKLFSSELIDYSIFNINLFKYIILNASTDSSLSLCHAVFDICKKGK